MHSLSKWRRQWRLSVWCIIGWVHCSWWTMLATLLCAQFHTNKGSIIFLFLLSIVLPNIYISYSPDCLDKCVNLFWSISSTDSDMSVYFFMVVSLTIVRRRVGGGYTWYRGIGYLRVPRLPSCYAHFNIVSALNFWLIPNSPATPS